MSSASSPLAALMQAIRSVEKSARQAESVLMQNESITRAVLIDPLLRALGWDIADLDRVEVEKTKDSRKVDYLLKKPGREVFAIVEAKLLKGIQKDSALDRQIGDYQRTFAIEQVWVTDGLQWMHYFSSNIHAKPHELHLRLDSLLETAEYLLMHLDAAHAWGLEEDAPDNALLQRMADLEARLAVLESSACEPAPASPPIAVHDPPKTYERPVRLPASQGDGKWLLLNNCGDLTGSKPAKVRLPDGTEKDVKEWVDVLQLMAEYLLSVKPDLELPYYRTKHKGTPIMNETSEGMHTSCRLNVASNQNKEVYLYTNNSTIVKIDMMRRMLESMPSESRTVDAAVMLRSR